MVPDHPQLFITRLLEWFDAARRPLPWRETYDPYGVWVSEIMLQQTQAERGARFFQAWMRRFPDLRSVAEADEEEVLAAWEGLGYYSRARHLHQAARRVMEAHGGRFPETVDLIRALPGVGDYTAGAVAAIAFNLPAPAVDANAVRVFARLLDLETPLGDPRLKAAVTGAVRELMPARSPRLFNQAIMELGALVCAQKPRCGSCPVAEHCAARRRGTADERPVKKAKAAFTLINMAAAVIMGPAERVFIQKRPPGGLWAGLWEFPGGPLQPGETPPLAAVRHAREQAGLEATEEREIAVVRHGYTTHRATLHGHLCRAAGPAAPGLRETRWADCRELAGLAFPAGHRKLLERLGWK